MDKINRVVANLEADKERAAAKGAAAGDAAAAPEDVVSG